jgi:hypothetical protein
LESESKSKVSWTDSTALPTGGVELNGAVTAILIVIVMVILAMFRVIFGFFRSIIICIYSTIFHETVNNVLRNSVSKTLL